MAAPERGGNIRRVRLIIVHHHLRPGGVRRVIELAAPAVADALPAAAGEIVLATGEAPDATWWRGFAQRLAPRAVSFVVAPALGYLAEQSAGTRTRARRLARFTAALLHDATPANCVVWCHNPGLGRNPLLNRVLAAACSARGVPLVFHHHDWWFDNRWRRWPEMRRSGFRTLAAVAEAILPGAPNVRHAAINQPDAGLLRAGFGRRSAWLPNPADAAPRPAPTRVRRARAWLTELLGDDAPVWIVPCRLLRRKNLAESLLLTRWLRPEAWLVTTGGLSSADEEPYARTLATAARAAGWRLRLSVLANGEAGKPTVAELLAASEAVLLTSIQEGFGLPYLEAAAAGRPLLARALPNIAPDLARFGFRFPQLYDELLIDPGLLDATAERTRQRRRFAAWRRELPRPCRPLAAPPPLLADAAWSHPVPFSRLTLAGQLEVLRHSADESWARCAPLNPFLAIWRRRADHTALQASAWPRRADHWLGGEAYRGAFRRLLAAAPAPGDGTATPAATQRAFLHAKLHPANLYPLSWDIRP